MKQLRMIFGFLILAMGLAAIACSNSAAGPSAPAIYSVTFSGLSANGTSGTVTTTALTLSFDVDPSSLVPGDIMVTGATKGTLSGTGTTRTLDISAITVANGANVTVALVNPAGFTVTPVSQVVAINNYSLGLTMLSVPAGTFQRDATVGNTSTVSAFRMSEKEITRDQFVAMLVTDPSNTGHSNGTSDPVEQVTWYQAIAFCNKLSLAEGRTLVYSVTGVDFATLAYADIPKIRNAAWDAASETWTNDGYRLPTEMEWMWAAMGATSDRSNGYSGTGTNTKGYTKGYAGSTELAGAQAHITDYAWCNYANNWHSYPAGTKLPNELGLYDMSGNVWEYNWDWYGTYPTGAQTDYRGPAPGTKRIFRGGSWYGDTSNCILAARISGDPNSQSINVGFRVVRP